MASPNVVQITPQNFESEVLKSPIPVLVDFWAEWCGPCRAIGPVIDQLADAYAGKVKVVKINVDENQEIAGRYRIQAIPALMIFKGGAVAEQIRAMGKKDLEQKLSAYAA